ncbi:MAG TPA: LysE family translocator [Acidimicrobiales bacterium]|nr:LysE family translocator [Acidimicrobiales bacterium]
MLVSLATFVLAAVLVVLLPGPDTLVVVRNLLRGGRKLAARTVLGVLTGLTVWAVTAVLGLSAVLRASHDAYIGLRLVGAAYLVYLGVSSLLARTKQHQSSRPLLGKGYTAGLLSDLLNPKVGVFFVTFLPGFVPHGYPVGWTSLLFGGIFIALTASYFALMLVCSGPVTRWMTNAQLRRRLDRCTGLVLIGFGMRLALDP